jgi:ferredoxin--NADP+ reductase
MSSATDPTPLSDPEASRDVYNATVADIVRPQHELMILRVTLDGGPLPLEPGQYTTLGLGVWEPMVSAVRSAADAAAADDAIIKRAYSVSCPMLVEGRLARLADLSFTEFYITLVHPDPPNRPTLTPRLFALRPGSRIHMGAQAKGHYTLEPVGPDDDVVFAGTGTGEAPHNAMLAELLARGHRGRIVVLTSARYRRDLAYLNAHRELERRYANYRYVPLTTREPENLDPHAPGYLGKQYVQHVLAGERFEQATGWRLEAARAHVFLCGNPAMIGWPKRERGGPPVFPQPRGAAEVLHGLGFPLDEPKQPGRVHIEKYW